MGLNWGCRVLKGYTGGKKVWPAVKICGVAREWREKTGPCYRAKDETGRIGNGEQKRVRMSCKKNLGWHSQWIPRLRVPPGVD